MTSKQLTTTTIGAVLALGIGFGTINADVLRQNAGADYFVVEGEDR